MIHLLKKIKDLPELTPDREWFYVNKAHLLAQIDSRQRQMSVARLSLAERFNLITLKVTRRLVPSPVKVMALVLVLAMVSSTALIAEAAVPGEPLYSVKLSIEKAQLAFASDPVSEGELLLQHANNRLWELEILASRDLEVSAKQQAISNVIRQFEKNMIAADSNLRLAITENRDSVRTAHLARSLNKRASETTKRLQQQAKDIGGLVFVDGVVISGGQEYEHVSVNRNSGIDVAQEATRGTTVNAAGSAVVAALTDAIKTNQTVGAEALNTVLGINDGQSVASDEDLQALVTDKISTQEGDLANVNKVLANVNTQDVKNSIFNGEAPDITYSEVNGLDSGRTTSETALSEAKALLNEGNISEALDKVIESEKLLEQTVSTLSKIDRLGGIIVDSKEILGEPVDQTVEMQSVKTTSSTGEIDQ